MSKTTLDCSGRTWYVSVSNGTITVKVDRMKFTALTPSAMEGKIRSKLGVDDWCAHKIYTAILTVF